MKKKTLELSLHPGYREQDLKNLVLKKCRKKKSEYRIVKKSLDCRDHNNIVWRVRVELGKKNDLNSDPGKSELFTYKKRNKCAVVVGSGPAGFFSALSLILSGFKVVIIEQGMDVDTRSEDISEFERTDNLNERSNYLFGEGGAGTFSDGKLTSRTKGIQDLKDFIFKTYIYAGAPEEIFYLSSPHIGSDNLKLVVKNLRNDFMKRGGKVLFNTKVDDFSVENNRVTKVITDKGEEIRGDIFVFAHGHSSYDTSIMLMNNNVKFRTKSFAVGSRIEHDQRIINRAQWGQDHIRGLKNAEYRFTWHNNRGDYVYTFCMCPGGRVVASAPYKGVNIVNGMSNYKRNSKFANSALVYAVSPEHLFNKPDITPLDTLRRLKSLEQKFYEYAGGYKAPFVPVDVFTGSKKSDFDIPETSYVNGLMKADFRHLMPEIIYNPLKEALLYFSYKINGFDKGIVLGLESKTSAPVQIIRDSFNRPMGFDNLFVCGEGSGYSGGIISSAAEGIKTSLLIRDTF